MWSLEILLTPWVKIGLSVFLWIDLALIFAWLALHYTVEKKGYDQGVRDEKERNSAPVALKKESDSLWDYLRGG